MFLLYVLVTIVPPSDKTSPSPDKTIYPVYELRGALLYGVSFVSLYRKVKYYISVYLLLF